MSDLISRKAVMEEINSLTVTITGLRAGKGVLSQFAVEYKKSILKIIDEASTAYDVYKVMIQLETAKELHDDECGFDEFEFLDCDTAIEIVRKGGLEE